MTSSEVPAEALELREGVQLCEASQLSGSRFTPEPGSVFDAQGRVPIVVIRPGIGRGKGKHLYEAGMLRENAHKFTGWRQFVNHQSPEAKKAAAGLPRDVRDLGGRITESWWDPSFPADPAKGHDQGAVLGLSKPVPYIRELIESDPQILEASIAASATGVRPVTRDNQKVWLVEGIHDRGSVDWVTEAGAGGRVAPLLEAAYSSEDDMDTALLESLTDDEFVQHMRDHRPHLTLAEAAPPEPNNEGGAVPDITPEALQEALAKDPSLIVEALQRSSDAQDFLRGLMEATIEAEREVIRAETRAETQREIALRDMRDTAHSIIRESKLPASWQSDIARRYDLVEGLPTAGLDIADEVDDKGAVVKDAMTALRESVEADIAAEQAKFREASPTRVRQQGPSGPDGTAPKFDAKKTGWGSFLQENANVNPNDAYAIHGAGADA